MEARIALIDYLLEDLDSIEQALIDAGADVVVTSDFDELATCKGMVLCGHTIFEDAILQMREMRLDGPIKAFIASGRPTLAIGLGMQLMFAVGREVEPGRIGDHVVDGLGIRPGSTPPLEAKDWYDNPIELPHTGFAPVTYDKRCPTPLLQGLPDGESYYFDHYFAVPTGPWVQAWAEYSQQAQPFPAVIDFDRTCFGVQFHPELSGEAGLALLRRFVDIVASAPEPAPLALEQGPMPSL